jgi:hypothetical protein
LAEAFLYFDFTIEDELAVTSRLSLYTKITFPFLEIATGSPLRKALLLATFAAVLMAALKEIIPMVDPFFI